MLLVHRPDAAANLPQSSAGQPGNILIAKQQASGCRTQGCIQEPHERRFAGPTWPDHRHALTRLETEGDIVDGDRAVGEDFAEVLQPVHPPSCYLIIPPCRAASSIGAKISSD